MNAFPPLWLPILVAAVLVFVVSSLIHMLFEWRNSDYRKLPNEDHVLAALRAGSPAPGQYVLPHRAPFDRRPQLLDLCRRQRASRHLDGKPLGQRRQGSARRIHLCRGQRRNILVAVAVTGVQRNGAYNSAAYNGITIVL